ncbi:EAL domain-containing protein [Colwellia sp. D2M02]|uniref:putative bifunctional diguanylate cyclase/phosphodiesterase n=1 Tax=Colwellia sp. D2M02 TaxID=2841562 RepID=UPI001C07F984|nr:GGDEF domain-containing phosphodiesterase [Colwellia sp. D2M02]MBU2894243.1 EAL domain-containing protein [Colwellia sp. D2M02]
MNKNQDGFNFLLVGIFLLLLGIVYSTFLALHHEFAPVVTYSVACVLLLAAYFSKYLNIGYDIRQASSLVAFVIIVVSGIVFPNDLEAIEEMYLLIPLIFLFVLPGSMWPIFIAFGLLSAYLPSMADHELSDLIEDGLELIVISSFATIMTYFQQKSLKQMEHFKLDSYTDYLTGLFNRKKFMEYMTIFQQRHKKNEQSGFALLTFDLDDFKKINDQLGHLAGDQVLRQMAIRLDKISHGNAIAFRTGGDEFAFILTSDDKNTLSQQSQLLAQQLIAFSEQAYRVSTKKFFVSSSIGIALYPQDAVEIETLYSNADLAMYKSKEKGRNCYSFYDTRIMEAATRRYELEDALKTAIVNNELFLLYQPKVCLSTGRIHSAEALIRWEHPKYGLISPMEFIPIAESSLAIIPIGQWVLEQVCLQSARWQAYPNLTSIAANVSSVQLTDSNFINVVKSALANANCAGERLEIEQTESWFMDDPDNNVKILSEIKKLGVQLSLDDFGTAYSSLSQLGRLPLDILKIDKSFIDDCVHNDRDHMIVRTIIQLGHNLGMKIVAEGVEYEAQRQLLESEGCEYYQGYLYAKPVTAQEFEALLVAEY